MNVALALPVTLVWSAKNNPAKDTEELEDLRSVNGLATVALVAPVFGWIPQTAITRSPEADATVPVLADDVLPEFELVARTGDVIAIPEYSATITVTACDEDDGITAVVHDPPAVPEYSHSDVYKVEKFPYVPTSE